MERTKAELKRRGWPLMAVVERWNPHCKIRQDLFGFIDLLAVNKNEILAVQVTTSAHVADHLAKIRQNQAHLIWLASPTRRLVIHGWGKYGAKGKRKLWECREVEITLTTAQVEIVHGFGLVHGLESLLARPSSAKV